jgi:fumarylacetoacetase
MYEIDFTHDSARKSWVESANSVGCDFPIQNLPFGIYQRSGESPRIGIAIGNQILDLAGCAENKLLPERAADPARMTQLNEIMMLPTPARLALRHRISNLLHEGNTSERSKLESLLVPQSDVRMELPCQIHDYSDFYASLFHAMNVGSMFRPDNPLLPNYKHIPIGYHGRASSIVVSGTEVRRPVGQKAPADDRSPPTHSASEQLDYELEVGFFVAQANELGSTIPIEQAEEHIFGMCLVNDWSARDLQRWEYQPLGPFLAKSFATSISPWVVTMEALAPFRCAEFQRPEGDPRPLDYLESQANQNSGGVLINLDVYLASRQMRESNTPAIKLSSTSFTNMYWTIAQMLTHHASNGCNLRAGDLMASGTVSGPGRGERGCLLELTWNGDFQNPVPGTDRTPLELPTGERRKFLEDGDEVIFRGYCETSSHRRIGFGECRGIIK